jgi:hypothetical protein
MKKSTLLACAAALAVAGSIGLGASAPAEAAKRVKNTPYWCGWYGYYCGPGWGWRYANWQPNPPGGLGGPPAWWRPDAAPGPTRPYSPWRRTAY